MKRLCELVEIERSSYYAWKAASAGPCRTGPPPTRSWPNGSGPIHDDRQHRRGAADRPRSSTTASRAEERVNHKRVARVMREHGIAGYQEAPRVRTTIPEPSDQKVPDLLKRDFTAEAPNRRYVGDLKCRRRHLMSYADPRNMPTVLAMAQANGGAEVQKVGIVA